MTFINIIRSQGEHRTFSFRPFQTVYGDRIGGRIVYSRYRMLRTSPLSRILREWMLEHFGPFQNSNRPHVTHTLMYKVHQSLYLPTYSEASCAAQFGPSPIFPQYPACSCRWSDLADSPASLIASSSPRSFAKYSLMSSALIACPLSANCWKKGFSLSLSWL